jgi:hypothetical protein
VYSMGQKMRVVCNPDRGCIEDTVVARWGDALIDLILARAFFAPLLYYKGVPALGDPNAKVLSLRPDA